ncbi:MAG: hypothetical protein IKZ55_07155 [Bacteroidales bacterium]|nr:hypothetical protein [Bacteroidales bacterium]
MNDGLKGYFVGNAVMGSVVSDMRRTRLDYQRRSAHQMKEEVLSEAVARFLLKDDEEAALEYLNTCFMNEVIDDCKNQADRNYSLETILVKRKAKYAPFYERIGQPMPKKLAKLTADELCAMLGVKNLHIKDSRGNKDIIPYEAKKSFGEWLLDWWQLVLSVLIVLGAFLYLRLFYWG